MTGDEQTSNTIFVIGVLVLVAALIGSAYVGLGNIRLPLQQKQAAEGAPAKVAAYLADRADRCWTRAGEGASPEMQDCFLIRVEPSGDVDSSMVEEQLSNLPPDRFSMEDINVGTQTTVKVAYSPYDGSVSITRFQVCDPAAGDDCRLSKCQCDTVCQPFYDPDGDGTTENDSFGCVPPDYLPVEDGGDGSVPGPEVTLSATVTDNDAGEVAVDLTAAEGLNPVDTCNLQWGDGASEELATDATGATHTYDDPGEYSLTYVCRDTVGLRGSAAATVTIEDSGSGTGDACVGGGECYADKVCSGDATITVGPSASLNDLRTAINSASNGDVVFVDPAASIDTGLDAEINIPAGVTVAGGRGCGGADGALIYTDDVAPGEYTNEEIFRLTNDNVRITGFRIRGPRRRSSWHAYKKKEGKGIHMTGTTNVEIDNNNIFGFDHSAVRGGASPSIHHNYIHHQTQNGLGYGVAGTDNSIVEYNRFNYNRHHIAGGGRESYTFRYNHIGPNGKIHSIDMHPEGGETLIIHHNTVEFTGNANVRIRGSGPSDVGKIHHNWFYRSSQSSALDLAGSDSQYEVHDNHYGTSEPSSCDIGAPRDSC